MIDDLEGEIRPGDGVAVRATGVAMLVLPSDDQGDGTRRLIDLVRQKSPTAGGRRLARRLAAMLGAPDGDDTPPFALVVDDADGIVVFVYGPMRVDVDGDEPFSVSGALSATWVDRVVTTVVRSIRLVATDGTAIASGPGPRFILNAGVVPAGEILLAATASESVMAPMPVLPPPVGLLPPPIGVVALRLDAAPNAEVASEADELEAMMLDVVPDAEVREPLPLVGEAVRGPATPPHGVELIEGISCSREHINDPSSSYCSACGISLVHRTHNLVVGPRPPLGFLVFDDGSIYSLDRGYVVGREPDDDPDVAAGMMRPLVIDDPDRSISRVHAEVVLEGWDVKIIDGASTNGTFVFDADQDQWQQLEPGVPFTVPPSARLAFGSRTVVYETPHRAPGQQAGRRPQPVRGGR